MFTNWDWSSLNLPAIIPVIFAIAGFYWVTKYDMKTLKENVVEIKRALARQTEIISQLAVQKERLDNQGTLIGSMQVAQRQAEQRLYELSHGQGFVVTNKDS